MPTRIQFMTTEWEPVRINPEKVDHIIGHCSIPGASILYLANAGVAAGGGPMAVWVMGTVEDIEAKLTAPADGVASARESVADGAARKGEDRG